MTRAEAEKKLVSLLEQADAIRRDYCPEDDYLTMTIINGSVMANNTYWADGAKHPVHIHVNGEARNDEG